MKALEMESPWITHLSTKSNVRDTGPKMEEKKPYEHPVTD